jgi:gamma-glutamylcyclotransferase (GGCT)/AIG2-like uncharacterized protein YtfP
MCEDIMRAVSGHRAAHEPATLDGFSRHPVTGQRYPGIRPHAGGRVVGVLYRDLPAQALARLDAFEGEQYVRRIVRVTLADGAMLRAATYVFKAAYAHLLGPGEWDFDAFLRTGKAPFEAQYLGFAHIPR